MKFCFHNVPEWPEQAWLARLERGAQQINVWHGSAVEVAEQWFCEAVWDGSFREGGFDRTDIVAGSGGRARSDKVTFVSSGSTVDRLASVSIDQVIWLSNSLACVLSNTDRAVAVAYPHYIALFGSIVRGIRAYERHVPLESSPQAELLYFDNWCWDGATLERVPKPNNDRALNNFNDYHSFLSQALERVVDNMTDRDRARSLSMLGTLSTGYDSTAVTALARPFGLTEVACFVRKSGRDSGVPLASHLNVTPIAVELSAWRNGRFPEVPFLAANAAGEEVHFNALAPTLKGRVLLTGYHGDKVWERDTPSVSPNIVRGDLSGLALTEFRLEAGFLNCPVPFWGCRQMAAIREISRSAEMSDWDIGGSYNRPICRRLAEPAGLPRELFGQQKSMASRWFFNEGQSITDDSFRDAREFLLHHRKSFTQKLRPPPGMFVGLESLGNGALLAASRLIIQTPGFFRLGLDKRSLFGGLIALRIPNPPHVAIVLGVHRYLFPWAMERAKQRYVAID